MANIELSAPQSWRELTQEQLRYVFFLLATFADMTVVKTYMFVRFTGISILCKNRYGWKALRPWTIGWMLFKIFRLFIRCYRKTQRQSGSFLLATTSAWNSNISCSIALAMSST